MCGKEGHLSSVCKSKAKAVVAKQNNARKQDEEDSGDEEVTTASSAYFFATNLVAENLKHVFAHVNSMEGKTVAESKAKKSKGSCIVQKG